MKYLQAIILCLIIPTTIMAGNWDETYKQVEQSIRQPKFVNHSYYITNYGASVKAPASINQKAINMAITACSKAGGGKVIIPSGTWKTGALRLKSHVNLIVDKNATLLFIFDTKLYPLVLTRWEGLDCWNYSPLIYAYQATDIAITGEGVIDGGGTNETWWKWCGATKYGWREGLQNQSKSGRPILQKWSEDGVDVSKRKLGNGYAMRPQLINFNKCNGILIEGVTLLRSPFWVIHPLLSQNITVKNVHIENDGPNGDGCDPESCDKVLIENCFFHTGDDCIAIKSGRNADGRKWNIPSQNIIIRGCTMADGHGGVVVGSEITGGCKNIFIENCKMDSPNLERVLRLKTNSCRGGIIENIFMRNVEVGQCREAVLKINLDYEHDEICCRGFNPIVRNIYMDNVTCKKSKYGVMIIALDSVTNAYNIHVNKCTFDGVESGGNSITGKTRDIDFNNLYINGNLVLLNRPYINWSEWMVASEMKRSPKSFLLDFAKKPRWSYVMGIELESFLDVYQHYGNQNILKYLKEYTDTMINDKGNIISYKMSDYNLDQVRTGRFILRMNNLEPQKKEKFAIKTLFQQLEKQPRTQEGIWWHKNIYKEQVWLDGIYMGLPFYTMAAPSMTKHPDKVYDDAINQIIRTANRTYDANTGLYRHAWDESHSMFWADHTTGLSQHTWGRAEGWMTMAIIELLDVIPTNYSRRSELIDLLNKVMTGVIKYQDKNSGLWYQVMDIGNSKEGNYLEATCSSMFTYALLKSYRKGYLSSTFRDAGIKGFNGIINHFIKINPDSTISLTRCCSVAGLGPATSPHRDGSFNYYISEPIRDNDAKGIGPFIWAALEMEIINNDSTLQPIDRKAVVSRNNPIIEKADKLASLTIGNGHFAATVDITGLQSYPEYYKEGVPLTTMSSWGWHSFPNTKKLKPEESFKSFDFDHGHKETYAVEYKQTGRQNDATNYYRINPHRLNLGTMGLEIRDCNNEIIPIERIRDIHQKLDLWNGIIKSKFVADGNLVEVESVCHPNKDYITTTIKTELFSMRRANVAFRFSYPSGGHSDDGNNWDKGNLHSTSVIGKGDNFVLLKRTIDSTIYYVRIEWTGKANFIQVKDHYFTLSPEKNGLSFSCLYSSTLPQPIMKGFDLTKKESSKAWKKFWTEGAFIDFAGCTDIRAKELERRVVLSEYLTAIQCAANMPPQESGLTYNTWFGRPHLEMVWWHALHFSLWNRAQQVSNILTWYSTAYPNALAIAKRQGFKGVRWMKMTDPWAGEAPSNVGSFLIWQQPHYIYLAEEMYRAHPSPSTLSIYGKIVQATAEFIADFASYDTISKHYILKGETAMQESMSKTNSYNQPFELAYWHYALITAQKWRERQGLQRDKKWDDIINNISPLTEKNGVYLAGIDLNGIDSTYLYDCRSDHPAVLGACGMLPASPLYDIKTMSKTFDWVMKNWDLSTTWGWDYGMMAMTAARLNRPDDAVNALMVNTQKNTYLTNGHNYQDNRLRIYLPGNGALLEAVAMMCAGWDGCPNIQNPGFPQNGKWKIHWEGLKKMQ
jgi:polygalacturonase/rhamnogalacturonyl hydrolase YesR